MTDLEDRSPPPAATPMDLIRNPNIRKKFFILAFDWVANAVVYNGLSYNTTNLGVSDYLAFFIGKARSRPSRPIVASCRVSSLVNMFSHARCGAYAKMLSIDEHESLDLYQERDAIGEVFAGRITFLAVFQVASSKYPPT